MRLLVEAGADVNAREPLRGTTALMWAVEQRHPEAVEVLLAAGADHSRAGPAGPACRATTWRRASTRAPSRRRRSAASARWPPAAPTKQQLEWEFENNIDLGGAAQRVHARVARAAAAQARLAQPAPGGAAAGAAAAPAQRLPRRLPARRPARLARAAGAAPRQPAAATPAAPDADDDDTRWSLPGLVGSGGGGLTPLVFAAREGDIESARLLLDGRRQRQPDDRVRLDAAADGGQQPQLPAGAAAARAAAPTSNLANKGGWTPLYLATDNRNIEGGDYPVPKAGPRSPRADRAAARRRAPTRTCAVKDNTLTRTIFTMQWFFEDGATPFIRAAQSSDTALMKLLLEHGADPKAVTASGDNALTASAGIGWVDGVTYERSPKENLEAVRMLLDLGLDPEPREQRRAHAADGRGAEGPRRRDPAAGRARRASSTRATAAAATRTSPARTIAGVTWQAIDYAEGLVRVGVQSAVERPEAVGADPQADAERGLTVPPASRTLNSICVVALCQTCSSRIARRCSSQPWLVAAAAIAGLRRALRVAWRRCRAASRALRPRRQAARPARARRASSGRVRRPEAPSTPTASPATTSALKTGGLALERR